MKILPNNIKAIIFDLGGVILNLDPQKTLNAFSKITGLSVVELIKHQKNDAFIQYEKGEITSREFRKKLISLFNTPMTDNAIDSAWNAMLLDLPIKELNMIGKLRPTYQTFILSNTNEIHIEAFNAIVKNTTKNGEINNFFNKIYYSYKVGMRKPDCDIFEMVIKENNLDAPTTLFIDDTLEHIKSAKLLGLQTWHLKNQTDLFKVFNNG